MTTKQEITLTGGNLDIRGTTVLTGVPENVILTPASADGVFIGAVLDKSKSKHLVPLGELQKSRLLACFRFKLWWMSHMTGQLAQDIPKETQFLLLETKDSWEETSDNNEKKESSGISGVRYCYTVMLPLIEGSFRASFQGNPDGILELCLESGDTDKKASSFSHSVFIGVGDDPFETIAVATATVQAKLKSFRRRQEKTPPKIVDYFGWCTWDAFYQEVDHEGVVAGLESLTEGGTPPKFVIIDDGWQCTAADNIQEEEKKNPLRRLTGIKENKKFHEGMKGVVEVAKGKVGVKYVYVWHAITGYWGGLRVGGEEMGKYRPLMKYPVVSDGVMENEPGWESDAMALQGVGLVHPEKASEFYDDMHGHLAEAGVDGVKVDVQCTLETVGEGLGGRVEVSRRFHGSLDESVAKHFKGNGIIACMSHGIDALYCSNQTAVVRASDDFFPHDPVSHSIHIAAVAYNSIFLGEIMVPDWDMFHSVHPAAEFHASARAISGGPIYVSDVPGKHNFDLLRKLVLPDGSVFRACLPGRPTKDCLFTDPCRDGVSLLKIWNMNKETGVLGVYNCQGAAWNIKEKKNTFLPHHESETGPVVGVVRASDVHGIAKIVAERRRRRRTEWDGVCAIYSHRGSNLATLPVHGDITLGLDQLEFEVFTVSPVEELVAATGGINFAALGLIDMFNGGGAVDFVDYVDDDNHGGTVDGKVVVKVAVKGCGRFGAYSSKRPKECRLGSAADAGMAVFFTYEESSGLITVELGEMPSGDGGVHLVQFGW